jgi:hypothetical protein
MAKSSRNVFASLILRHTLESSFYSPWPDRDLNENWRLSVPQKAAEPEVEFEAHVDERTAAGHDRRDRRTFRHDQVRVGRVLVEWLSVDFSLSINRTPTAAGSIGIAHPGFACRRIEQDRGVVANRGNRESANIAGCLVSFGVPLLRKHPSPRTQEHENEERNGNPLGHGMLL